MTSKTSNLSLLMENISQEIGIDINKQVISKSLKKRTPSTIKKTYNSGNYKASQSQILTRKLNLENNGQLVINSSLDESSSLAEYTVKLQEKDIQNTLFIDKKLENMIQSSINIIKYRNEIQFDKKIENFYIEVTINWNQKENIERISSKFEIVPIYKKVNTTIEGPREVILNNSLPSITVGHATVNKYFSIFYDDLKRLIGDIKSDIITLTHEKNNQWNVYSDMFTTLKKRLTGEITVESAILNGREEEFIALCEMATL